MILDVRTGQKIVIDSTTFLSLSKDSVAFFTDEFIKFLQNNGLACFVLDTVMVELKNTKDKEKQMQAEELLKVLSANMLIEIIKTGKQDDREAMNILVSSSKLDLCLITNDIVLAKALMRKNGNNSAFCLRDKAFINWNELFITEEKSLFSSETTKKLEKVVDNNNELLLINFVIDTSCYLKGERFLKLTESLKHFHEKLAKENLLKRVNYAITSFRNFEPVIIKKYNETELDVTKLSANGIPVLGESIVKSLEELNLYMREAMKITTLYKPWVFILTGGENYGDLTPATNLINKLCTAKTISYFPFTMVHDDVSKELIEFKKIKKPINIRDDNYEALFNWIFTFASERVKLPSSAAIGLDQKVFEGWTIK